ncbi:MAG: PilW family protein, partial [Thermoguttaceae bacterium]
RYAVWPARGKPRRYANSEPLIPNPRSFPPRSAYTLVELLISTVMALIVMFAVVSIFGMIGQGVSDSQATLEMSENLRQAAATLKNDLEGVTVTMDPPRSPESGEGYFEYTEGPIGPVLRPDVVAFNTDVDGQPVPDTVVGDIDDILMMTVRSRSEPFVGRTRVKRYCLPSEKPDGVDNGAGTLPQPQPFVLVRSVESHEAEVIWFVRGRTLYRRVLLILPQHDADLRTPEGQFPGPSQMQLDPSNNPVVPPGPGFYHDYDISVRIDTRTGLLTPNTLADLTKPENRFAHRPRHRLGPGPNDYGSRFPFHPHFQADYTNATLLASAWGPPSLPPYVGLGLPTLRECSHPSWVAGGDLPLLPEVQPSGPFDFWRNPHPWTGVDPDTGCLAAYPGPRVAEDAILDHVIGFDVKAWDPGAPVLLGASGEALLPGEPGYMNALQAGAQPVSRGAYVDLNYGCLLGPAGCARLVAAGSVFAGPGDPRSMTWGTEPASAPRVLRSAVYDTWSRHYENDGIKQNAVPSLPADAATNGFDDDGDGVVDDPGEADAPPPYAVPLRGIQVTIRVFEPSSRQIRQVTVVQEFVTK